VLIPELNSGHLKVMIQNKYFKSVIGLNKVQGLPLKSDEVEEKVNQLLNIKGSN
jgi:hypothetical protein